MTNNQIILSGLALFSGFILLIFLINKWMHSDENFTSIFNLFFKRYQPAQSVSTIIKSGIGGLITIGLVSLMSQLTNNVLLMAPFGATCVLLFSIPQSPLSQPINVVGGHIVSTAIGLLLHVFLPTEWWTLGLAVGMAIAVMAFLRITHPPAGADPLVVFFINPAWDYIIFPVAIGSILLVVIAWLFHKLPEKTPYPISTQLK